MNTTNNTSNTNNNEDPSNISHNDSISMYTNFLPQRLSTDSNSLNSYLNLPPQQQHQQQNPDLSSIGRGFSIINSIWQPQQPSTTGTTTATAPTSLPIQPALNQQKPHFNVPSFGDQKRNSFLAPPPPLTQQQQQQQHHPGTIVPSDDLDFLRKDSISNYLKPPLLPQHSTTKDDFETLLTKRRKSSLTSNESNKRFKLDDLDTSSLDTNDMRNLLGSTKVDQLMLMIQARQKGITDRVPTNSNGDLLINEHSNILPSKDELVGGIEKPSHVDYNDGGTDTTSPTKRSISTPSTTSSARPKKHECPYCHRLFSQSTHLEVHIRSHIGYKPFQCQFCGKKFTQGGNLRTHQRLHTGEKPYQCESCGRRFSRKGNLAAHILTHKNLKPFVCKLDNCDKSFTQLGNMKAHQNRFHLNTLIELTNKLATYETNLTDIPEQDKDLLNYFASIYKNSNKGIKGRGKGSSKINPH
ncbi:hypothetical protein KAFR_0C04550 [Kazachstania africana CBS 2517]|uniref:C2H2-type domain-containing protein n=1 Tax=Kazachstania africana (strain ATCC 22294 / BCRC 22015 / CBS 2517 / CECT 1963 / NBRC 1671 / NRRL Y-8276) TaxID=1071382 RepID=H2ASU6_KAZAF|nr:hypothetical protein KAFR_0C04550 [Kazachstania africana CBS 2517]CCF57446.1 hypothetical protein KAFR_0C04550 [Kazachstania africana CBS 2517]